jgi:predicted HicB family RNase H-like nuclease
MDKKPGTVRLYIPDFPAKLHKQAKIQAAEEDIPLKMLVRRAVKEYLEKR